MSKTYSKTRILVECALMIALGTVLGLVTGLLDCWMLSLLIWGGMALSGGSVAWLSQEAVSGSVLYSLFAGLNPFLA